MLFIFERNTILVQVGNNLTLEENTIKMHYRYRATRLNITLVSHCNSWFWLPTEMKGLGMAQGQEKVKLKRIHVHSDLIPKVS